MNRLEGRASAGAATMFATSAIAVLVLLAGACASPEKGAEVPAEATLRMGFGLTAGATPEIGIQQAARNLALEGLVGVGRDGRPTPALAESWTPSADRLAWRIQLRSPLSFHDGTAVDAAGVREILRLQLAEALGPASDDLADIKVLSGRDLELTLRRASTFPMERLDDAVIEKPVKAASGTASIAIGTGQFAIVSQNEDQIVMRANGSYRAGRPLIDHVIIKPYESVRAAWADLLRGQLDMVYEVGVDALDSLEESSEIRTFTFQRGYAFLMLLNTRRPYLADASVRRTLNEAIDREALVRDGLRGHGTPAEGPVWPRHWAYSSTLPRFSYRPTPLPRQGRLRLKCLFVDRSHERIALMIQRQLGAIGVDLELEAVSTAQELGARLGKGDFDAALADFREGPNLARPYLLWHTGATNNYGYSNRRVDAALDDIRHATGDDGYRTGVAAFQRAMIDDPPAIFIAWRERARAVSTRFVVPAAEADSDVLRSIHRWRPVGRATPDRQN